MQTFVLTIVSATTVHFDDEARSCRVSTPTGEVGFEARHEPFLGALQQNSEVRFRDAIGQEHVLPIESGLLSFRDNRCTVTVEPRRDER